MFYVVCYFVYVLTTSIILSLCFLSWRKRHTTVGFYLLPWML